MITQQNSVFISPEESGSSVGYYISVNEYERKDKPTTYSICATVVLSDCTHKIDWNFDGEKLEKIDSAIKMLQEFRQKYIEMDKMIVRLNK